MKKFLQEFKAFAMRGNVIDLAVGVVIGGAFGKITTSLVNDIIMPFISMLTGGIDFTQWKWVLKPAAYGIQTLSEASNINRQSILIHKAIGLPQELHKPLSADYLPLAFH